MEQEGRKALKKIGCREICLRTELVDTFTTRSTFLDDQHLKQPSKKIKVLTETEALADYTNHNIIFRFMAHQKAKCFQ